MVPCSGFPPQIRNISIRTPPLFAILCKKQKTGAAHLTCAAPM